MARRLREDDLLSPRLFPDGREDLVLMGDVGTGKTHMAEVLEALARQRARPARFFTASSLVMRLRRARVTKEGFTASSPSSAGPSSWS